MNIRLPQELLTVEQLSLILNVSEFTIKKLTLAKQLPCVLKNRSPRFKFEELMTYFEKLEGGAV